MSTDLKGQEKAAGLKANREADTLNLQKVAERGAPKDEIIQRIERDKTLDEQRINFARQRRLRSRLRAAAVTLLTLAVASGLYYYFAFLRPPGPGPSPAESQGGVTVTKEQPIPSENYVLKKAAVVIPGTGTFDVQAYDFFSNKFLRGKEEVADPQALRAALTELQTLLSQQGKLRNSWVLVFAGASFDKNADTNLVLCNRRVDSIICIMSKELGISGLGYWKIPAGEYRAGLPNQPAPSEEEEEEIAKRMDENDLASQRRLIVLFVSPREAVPQDAGQRVMSTVGEALYDHDLLPSSYELHRPQPAPVNESTLKCAAKPPLR